MVFFLSLVLASEKNREKPRKQFPKFTQDLVLFSQKCRCKFCKIRFEFLVLTILMEIAQIMMFQIVKLCVQIVLLGRLENDLPKKNVFKFIQNC